MRPTRYYSWKVKFVAATVYCSRFLSIRDHEYDIMVETTQSGGVWHSCNDFSSSKKN